MLLITIKKEIMKKYVVIILALVSFGVFAQKRTVNIGDFNEVKTYNGLTVTLYPSQEQKVEISGVAADDVIVKNVNGTLKILTKIAKKAWGEDLIVKVYYKNLDTIDANEGSNIKSEEVFKQDALTIKAQEGATIRLQVALNDLDIKTISGGNISLDGKVKNQDIIANSGGMYEAFGLSSETATAKASSGAAIDINVTKRVKATASFGGEIYIKGNPKNVANKATLGGEVKILKK